MIRRVAFAEVKVAGVLAGSIGQGLLIYLGIHKDDELLDLEWIIQKILGLRIFEDQSGKMNLNIGEEQGILVVSQFTLWGNLKKGYRPSFNQAADSQKGKFFYDFALDKLNQQFAGRLESGVFGADMQVHAMDDGPVTIWVDSHNRDY